MIKVKQRSQYINASGEVSLSRDTDTWVNPEKIRAIECCKLFGARYANFDYVIHLEGMEIQCVGDVEDLINEINKTRFVFSCN